MERITLPLLALLAALVVAPAAHAAKPNIVELASSSKKFSTLVSLVKKAGLVDELSGNTKLTVFAPTNSAFAKVPKKTLNALADDKAALKSVLLYHVVAGAVPASDVVMMDSAETLNGASVSFSTKGKKVYVNNAQVKLPDLAASNGIVHGINRVLLPPS